MKHILASLIAVTLAACGGGSMEVVNVATNNPMPPGFILGVTMDPLAPKSSPLPFVAGPVVGPQVQPSPSIDPNICKPDAGGFVIGPCIPTNAPINWCSDGFVIGPCTPLPEPVCAKPGEVVVGPTPSCAKLD
jgi:hypothetical protein